MRVKFKGTEHLKNITDGKEYEIIKHNGHKVQVKDDMNRLFSIPIQYEDMDTIHKNRKFEECESYEVFDQEENEEHEEESDTDIIDSDDDTE